MSLSEEERRQLEELELDLAAGDPRLARELVSGSLKPAFRASTCFGTAACVAGAGLLLAGIVAQIVVLGAGGFVLLVAGASLLLDNRAILARSDRRTR